MRNIKMTMSRMHLNLKFMNNMLPEWGRFVIAVKLNRGLRDSNYDQLYAYLKQHEAHANENKMMLDRFTQHTMDPLALMSNVSHQQPYLQSSTTPPSIYVPPHLADNAHLDSVQDGRVMVQNVQGRLNRGQGNNPRGGGAAGFEGAQNRVRNANPDKMLLMQAQENRVALDEVQLLFLAGGQDNAIDEDVDEQHVQDLALNVDNVFQADDCDAFDSDVDEAPMAQTMFMANLSSVDHVYDEASLSYDSDIQSEVHDHDYYHDVICEHHEEHEMHENVQLNHVVDSHADYTSDSNMISYDHYVKDNVVPAIVHNTEDTLEIAEITRRKMNDKIKDPECVNHKVKIAPHDYSKENFLATFTPQKQLTPEQIFWSQNLIRMKTEALKEQTTTSRPIKALMVYPLNIPATLVHRVLPTKSQVKIHIFTLIQLFLEFDKTYKKKITPTGLTEGEMGFEFFIHFFRFFHTMNQKSRRVSRRAFMKLFGQDNKTFTSTMFLNLDQLQRQLNKDEFQEDKFVAAFRVIDNQFQKFIDWQYFVDYDSQMTEKFFAEYTRIKVTQFRETLLQHMGNVKKSVAERAHHQRHALDVVSSQALDADLVVMESNGTESGMRDTSSSSRNYITHIVDANIRLVNDQVPFAEVQLTAQHDVLANEQQHTDQSKPIYDTYLLEKVDSNTSLGSTNMSHRGGEFDQDAEHDQVKSPLLKVEFLKTKDMVEKEVYNELSNIFLQLEKHCFSLEISIQQKEESF
nr:actin-binding, cofilin/tropomyosin type [Tanacetum cinerariifolium]